MLSPRTRLDLIPNSMCQFFTIGNELENLNDVLAMLVLSPPILSKFDAVKTAWLSVTMIGRIGVDNYETTIKCCAIRKNYILMPYCILPINCGLANP